jgi:hypothetical protein
VVLVDQVSPASFSRLAHHHPRVRASRAPIIRAAYHHPLLAALSSNFRLYLYDLSEAKPRVTQTLTSFSCHPPSALVLSAPSPDSYKLVMSYATAVYPEHWSVGATELMVNGSGAISSRTACACDLPQGFVDARILAAVQTQWARRVRAVTATETDGRWVVLAPGAERGAPNALQLYRLHLPTTPGGRARLSFARALHGLEGPVAALALADGRCVALGTDENMHVWDLERGTGAEISGSPIETTVEGARLKGVTRGALVFDERKVVSVASDGIVHVRRFDI